MQDLHRPMTASPNQSDYQLLITSSWDDIHFARGQDWRALLVVAGVHVAILQALQMPKGPELPFSFAWLIVAGGLLAIAFIVIGVLVTCRHYQLMRIKLSWIYLAEEKLGLVGTNENLNAIIPREPKMEAMLDWKGLRWPRRFSASWLMICFYLAQGIVDLAAVTVSLIVCMSG